ncbi:MAG: 4Fe-4S dicluster domain-containing protein [Candidatus Aminicenantes bacterium]|nr:4Fe-4S dicluster domain-containing protein [Candidatus Aminicenantes bacterium]
MNFTRRLFLKHTVASGAGFFSLFRKKAHAKDHLPISAESQVGCLVDTTLCIGCRQCEKACNLNNNLAKPEVPFTDKSVFREMRRPTENALTVVNEYVGNPSPDQPQRANTYAKVQCMHCLDPACVSACIVGALTRAQDGAVVYNPTICLGCRYCMVACPFQIPAFEYEKALTPLIKKCEFCADFSTGTGADPSCAKACPTEAILFGKRSELLKLARDRIRKRPDRYLDHIYGEHEVGGTAWLYLAGRPTEEIDLLKLPGNAPPRLTENIQHTIFKFGAIPLVIYGALGAVMWHTNRKQNADQNVEEDKHG